MKVETYRVGYAVQALVGFCEKYGAKIDPYFIAKFAMAWREGRDFEWTPCNGKFRRICALCPTDSPTRRLAVVFSYEGVDEALTDELNTEIKNATDGEWL